MDNTLLPAFYKKMITYHTTGINKNEIFPCSKKDIKQFFGDFGEINVTIRFKRRNNYYFMGYSKELLPNEHPVLSFSFHCEILDKEVRGYHISLYIYAIKKEGFVDEKKEEFITEILPKIKEFYNKNINNKCFLVKTQYVDVKLIDGEFIINQ